MSEDIEKLRNEILPDTIRAAKQGVWGGEVMWLAMAYEKATQQIGWLTHRCTFRDDMITGLQAEIAKLKSREQLIWEAGWEYCQKQYLCIDDPVFNGMSAYQCMKRDHKVWLAAIESEAKKEKQC